MVHSDRVLKFCYEELVPQLKNHNFNIILCIKIGRREYIGRLLHISDIGYFMDLDMGFTESLDMVFPSIVIF